MKDASEGLLGHDVVEVFTTDLAAVGSCPLQHLFEFLDIHGFSKFLGDSSDVVGVDVSCVVVIEKVEDLVDAILGIINGVLWILCHPIWR